MAIRIKDPSAPATDRQVEGIIRRLQGSKVDPAIRQSIVDATQNGLTMGQASNFIMLLDGLNGTSPASAGNRTRGQELALGYYRHPQHGMCQVFLSREGHKYAGIVGGRYQRGLINELTADMRVDNAPDPMARLIVAASDNVTNLDEQTA